MVTRVHVLCILRIDFPYMQIGLLSRLRYDQLRDIKRGNWRHTLCRARNRLVGRFSSLHGCGVLFRDC